MIIDSLMVLALLISCYTDLRFQKIYNAVLFPTALLALGFHTGTVGLNGTVFALKGAGLGLALFFLPYLLGGIGAGDVKLLAVVGACKGTYFVFCSFLFAAIAGGVISLLVLIYRKKLLATLRQMGLALKTALMSRLTVWNFPKLDDENRASFPYGVAIVLGSISALMVV